MKGKIIVIVGKMASGKTSVVKNIMKSELGEKLSRVITYTTRPKRVGEVEGYDYNFIDYESFATNVDAFICQELYDIVGIGPTYYGVSVDSFEEDKNYLIVLNPTGYKEIKHYFGDRVHGIYIMASRKSRYERYISRDVLNEDIINEAKRRMKTDEEHFDELEYEIEDIVINNSTYEDMYNKVEKIIKEKCINID